MELRTLEDLSRFHNTLLGLKEHYKPPYSLMEKVDSEYRTFIESGCYYTWLALATRVLKPKRILELGNYHGASTIMIYSELTDETKAFYSVDLVRDIAFVPNKILSDKKVKFTFGNDLNLSIYGENLPIQIDFLFIDTLHEYRQIKDEWNIYKNLCTPNAIVILDDILLNDMPKFWAELPYPKLEISKDCHESGFGVFIYQQQDNKTLDENSMTKQAYISALEVAYQYMTYPNASVKPPSAIKRSVGYAKTLFNKKK